MNKITFQIFMFRFFKNKERYFKLIESVAKVQKTKNYIGNAKSYKDFPCFEEDIFDGGNDEFLSKKYEKNEVLAKKYDVENITKGGDTFSKAKNIMQWLTNNTMYSGLQSFKVVDDTDKVLNIALKNNFKSAICCRLKAIVLADLLISIGITALPLSLLGSFEEKGKKGLQCHFMVHIYLPEEKKWVVFDPSFNTYFTDKSGKILNIIELRNAIAQNNFPKIVGYNFNGDKLRCIEQYKTCFVKGCLEYVLTWQSNKRDISPKLKIFGIEFNYLMQPKGADFKTYWLTVNNSNQAKTFVKNIVCIGTKQLLSID